MTNLQLRTAPRYTYEQQMLVDVVGMVVAGSPYHAAEIKNQLADDEEQARQQFCEQYGLGSWFEESFETNNIRLLEVLDEVTRDTMHADEERFETLRDLNVAQAH